MTDLWPPKGLLFEHPDPFQNGLYNDSYNEMVAQCATIMRHQRPLTVADISPSGLAPKHYDTVHRFTEWLNLNEPAFIQIYEPPKVHHLEVDQYNIFYGIWHEMATKLYFAQNRNKSFSYLRATLTELIKVLDPLPQAAEGLFYAPAYYHLPNIASSIEHLLHVILGNSRDIGCPVFEELGDRLYSNVLRASGLPPLLPHLQRPQPSRRDGRSYPFPRGLTLPANCKLFPDELVYTYLRDTPLLEPFLRPIPFSLPTRQRLSHHHILAKTDRGKTTLITDMIVRDIQAPEKPCVIVIDPHAEMVNRLFKSDLPIDDRLIYISARDMNNLPAINPFDVKRFDNYDYIQKEEVRAGAIKTLTYLFNALGIDLTGKQNTLFQYVMRLMLALPEVTLEGETAPRPATLIDILTLLDDPEPYKAAIETLSTVPKSFFQSRFTTSSFRTTKDELAQRIDGILASPVLEKLFEARETKVDFFSAMNEGAIILVDTKGFPLFGTLVLSLIFRAVMERTVIEEDKRRPTYLYVDEATEFFSGASTFDEFLREARKFKCGLVLVHHDLQHADANLRASLATHPAIRFTSGPSPDDAAILAKQMRTTPEFILSRPRFHWAAYIEGVTDQAISFELPMPSPLTPLSDEAFAQRVARNRERVSAPTYIEEPYLEVAEPDYPPLKPETDEDGYSKW